MESYYRNWNPKKGAVIEKKSKGYSNSFHKKGINELSHETPEEVRNFIKERVQYLRSLEKEEEDYHF